MPGVAVVTLTDSSIGLVTINPGVTDSEITQTVAVTPELDQLLHPAGVETRAKPTGSSSLIVIGWVLAAPPTFWA